MDQYNFLATLKPWMKVSSAISSNLAAVCIVAAISTTSMHALVTSTISASIISLVAVHMESILDSLS